MLNCAECMQRAEALLAGSLPVEDRRELDEHLASCAECEARLAALSGADMKLEGEASEALIQDVLARTSGSACAGAHERLPAAVAGQLAAEDAQLLRLHVEHCADCADLEKSLAWITPLLPELALIEPDDDFVDDVIAGTVAAGRREQRPGWLKTWVTRWRRLQRRPRFAVEGAYAFTLVLVALFGTPLSPGKDAPTRALDIIQSGPGPLSASVLPDLSGLGEGLTESSESLWNRSGAHGVRATQDLIDDLEARRERTWPPLKSLGAHSIDLARAIGRLDWQYAGLQLGAIGQDWIDIWRACRMDTRNESETKEG